MKKFIIPAVVVVLMVFISAATLLNAKAAASPCSEAYQNTIKAITKTYNNALKAANNNYLAAQKAIDSAYKDVINGAAADYRAALSAVTTKAEKAATLEVYQEEKSSALKVRNKATAAAQKTKKIDTAAALRAFNDGKKSATASQKTCLKPSPATATIPPAIVASAGLRITTTSLPAWVSGQPGSFTITAEGGSLPLTWSVKSGSLPAGFALGQDGIVSGSYILPGGVTKKIFEPFTVEAKDQKGETKTVQLSITVVPEAPSIATYNPPTLTVGQSYDEKIATADGGMPPYKFYREAVSGPMPMGMQITSSGSNAVLSGSPKAKGNFSFRVCVVDAASVEKCGDVSFAVKEAEVAPAPAPTPVPESTEGKWEGTYRGVCTLTGSEIPSEIAAEEPQLCEDKKRIYCPPYFFWVTKDYIWAKGAHKSNSGNAWTELTGGDIDASGATTIHERDGNYNDTTSDYTLQFYLSDGGKYVKGTMLYTFPCSWYSIERRISWTRRCSCTFNLSGGPATAR